MNPCKTYFKNKSEIEAIERRIEEYKKGMGVLQSVLKEPEHVMMISTLFNLISDLQLRVELLEAMGTIKVGERDL